MATIHMRARNKYRAVRTEYGGCVYDSKAEARRAAELDLLVLAGDVAWWVRQVVFRLGCPENVYRVDFVVAERTKSCLFPDGVIVHAEDVKGVRTAKFARDAKLWRAYAPMPLRVISGGKVEVIPGGRGYGESPS